MRALNIASTLYIYTFIGATHKGLSRPNRPFLYKLCSFGSFVLIIRLMPIISRHHSSVIRFYTSSIHKYYVQTCITLTCI